MLGEFLVSPSLCVFEHQNLPVLWFKPIQRLREILFCFDLHQPFARRVLAIFLSGLTGRNCTVNQLASTSGGSVVIDHLA